MKYKFLRISLLSALAVLFSGTAFGAFMAAEANESESGGEANTSPVKVTWVLSDLVTTGVTDPATAALGDATCTVGEGFTILEAARQWNGMTFMQFQPVSDDFKGDNSYSKTMQKYIDFTFTPNGNFSLTKVSFDMIKIGTGDPKIYIDIIDGEGNAKTIASDVDIRRNNDDDATAVSQSYDVTTSPSTNAVTLRIYVGKLAYNKQVGLANVVIEGVIENAATGGDGEEGGDTDSAWTLETTLDFTPATYPEDPTIVLETSKCGTAYDTGNKKQQDIFKAIEPAELGGRLAFQAVSNGNGKGWWIRASKGGLWSYNAGRSAAVLDLTTGDRVVFHCTQSASTVMSLVNGNNEPDGPFVYELGEDGKSYICTMVGDGNIGFFGNQSQGYISSIEIYKPNGEVVLADYTVKYVSEEGNELKEPSVYQGIAGTVPTVSEADKARITVDDVTYIYASDDAADQIINKDGSTVVTIVFKKPEPISYKVNEVAGGQIVRTTEGKDIEGTSIKVPYRSHNVLDGKLYKRGVTNKEYNHTFTLTTDGQVVNLDYTATDVNNVVYLAEGEDIEGLTLCTGADAANSAIRSSNSAAAYAAEDVEIVTLGAGVYTLHAVIFDASKTPDSHWVFKAGEEEIADLHCTAINYEELASEEFTLTEETAIVMAKAGSNKMGLDLIYITGEGDVITGISSVNAKAENGEIYNLQGQKVEKAQKGLYIVNGKKVVVK